MHLNPTKSLGTVTLSHYLARISVHARPALWHPVSGRLQQELWNLNSALIHSPGRNIVTFMPFGLQKQLGSRAVLDICCSNLSFLGRFLNLCSAEQALYRMTSWSSNCILQCAVSPLLPSLTCLPYSSLSEARERTGLFCRPVPWGKQIAVTSGMMCRNSSRNDKPKESALTLLALLGTLLPLKYLQPL